jgi:vitamin B12 transporter
MKKVFALCCLLPLLTAASQLYPEESVGSESNVEISESDGVDSRSDYLDFGEDDGITVTETVSTTAQAKTVSKDEIERMAAPDLPTLLEEALDINITRRGAYGNTADINMRGFNTERIAILIDGVPVNSAMSGDFDFNTIDMNNIERIELVYGGSDSKYNVTGALGGVINIVTVKNQRPGLRFGAGIMNTSYMPGKYTEWNETKRQAQWQDLVDMQKSDISLSYGSDAFSWGVHAFTNRAENHYLYKDSLIHKVRRKEFNEVWDAGGGALFSWSFPNLSKLIINADTYYSDKNIPTTGFSSIAGVQNDVTTRESLMFDMPVAFHNDLSTEATLSHSWARMDYEREGMNPSRHDQQSITVINRWGWYPSELITFHTGWDYRFIYMDSTGIGEQGRHDGGLYLTVEYQPIKKLRIVPSIKTVSDGTAIVPVPKLGLFWSPSSFFSLRNNYFRSFKYPNFDDLYWSGGGAQGNPDLKPEDGWGADIGAEFQYREIFTAESTFFFQQTKDSIHWHRAIGGLWEPQNIGEAAFFGADTRLKANFPVSLGPLKKISPALSYQYLLTYLLSYGFTREDDKRLPYQPMHTIGASVDASWESGSILFSAHYETLRYYDVLNLIGLDPYLLLSVNFNQKIGKHITILAAIRNLLNQSYESYNRQPMPGITMTIGMRFNIEMKKENPGE